MSRPEAPLIKSGGNKSAIAVVVFPNGERIQFNESDFSADRLPMFEELQNFINKHRGEFPALRERFGHLLYGYIYKLMQIADLPQRLEEQGNEHHLLQFAHFFGVAPDFTLRFMTAMRRAAQRKGSAKNKAAKSIRLNFGTKAESLALSESISEASLSKARKKLSAIDKKAAKFKGFSVSPALE